MPDTKQKSEPVYGFTVEIGNRIKRTIESSGGLTAAAAIANTTDDTLMNWYKGNSRPNLFGISAIAHKAGVSVDWIMTGTEPDNSHLMGDVGDDRLYKTTRTLLEKITETDLHPSPEKLSRAIVLCYRLFKEKKREEDSETIIDQLTDLLKP
jgi:hypothetical protein